MMKAFNFFVLLFLLSNIKIAASNLSWLNEVWDILGNKMFRQMLELVIPMIKGLFDPDDLSFDSGCLKADLEKSLFGQPIASDVVLKAVSSFMSDSNPNKPLVLSFHGTTGTGKNHVAKIIARNVYKKGEQSEHIHLFLPELHFSDTAQIKQLIQKSVSSFPCSMFIFDEVDKMQPQLIDALKPFLDYNSYIDGVSFRNAIFVFLSNAGGNVISEVALGFWREDRRREEINSKELEAKILQHIMNEESGFSYSSLINKHLIDHYVPFLPLELKHVRQCVMAEMVHLNMTQDYDLADQVARDMPYYPEKEKIFAVKGCKSVRQKLPLYQI